MSLSAFGTVLSQLIRCGIVTNCLPCLFIYELAKVLINESESLLRFLDTVLSHSSGVISAVCT